MKLKIILSTIALVMIFVAFGQNNPVIDSLENVLKTAKADTVKVNVLNELSRHYTNISNYEIAMQYADSALVLADKLSYKKGIADSYYKIGIIYNFQGNYPEALKSHFASLKIRKEKGDKSGCGSSYNGIGKIYSNQGNYPEALKYLSLSVKTSEVTGNKKSLSNACNNLGQVYLIQGNYPEGMKYFNLALDLCHEIGYEKGIAIAHANLGEIYLQLGNYPEALKNYLSALKVFEESGNKKNIATIYSYIAGIYFKTDNYPEALKNYFAALKIHEEIGYKRGIACIFGNIGIIYKKQKKYQEALENTYAGLKIFEEIGDKRFIANAYNVTGLIYKEQENFPEALKFYKMGLKISEEIGNKPLIASSFQDIGRVYSKLGNFQDARKYIEDGLSLAKELGYMNDISLGYECLYELDSAEGNFYQALENYKMHTLYNDSLFNEASINQVAQMQIQYETEKKDKEIELLKKDKELHAQQLEKQGLIRKGMIAGAVLLLMVGLLLFRSFRLRKKLEKQQAIIQERKRISADLHDDVGSGLSRIILLSEMVKKVAKTPETRKEAVKIAAISQELSANISEIIWALNSNNDYVENLVAYIRRYAAEYFENSVVRLKINTPVKMEHIPISGEHRRNVFYAVKEALHNIIKHAQATEAKLKFTVKHNKLSVVINDNGKGFDQGEPNRFGNGLNNMRNRMKSINGSCLIENHNGTRVTLSLPV